ncbi:hypothetical protein BH23THE1_BH23THE1_24580 [soil metagenome]
MGFEEMGASHLITMSVAGGCSRDINYIDYTKIMISNQDIDVIFELYKLSSVVIPEKNTGPLTNYWNASSLNPR